MKCYIAIMFIAFLALASNPYTAFAQNKNDEAAKHTEKVRQKVVKLGTGDKATVQVVLFDETIISGYISEANDKTFVVMNKKSVPATVKYSDVKSLDHTAKMGSRQKYIWIGVAAGVGTVIAIVLHGLLTY